MLTSDATPIEKIVISVGGSLIVPNGGINTTFLKQFNKLIREELAKKNRQFFLEIGGGATARHYRDAGNNVLEGEIKDDDLDWLGIHSTRLNAHLIRTIFRDLANPQIIEHYDIIRKVTDPIVVASGWKPGWSTDYCATMLCEDYNIKTIINLSNIKKVYDKDPNQFQDAKPIDKIEWSKFQKIVGERWTPGMNAPFDPIATKKAAGLGLKVIVMQGDDFDNLRKYFSGQEFTGTIIEG